MSDDDRQRSRLRKLALKIGSVAGAAAALLGDNSANAKEGDVLAETLKRNEVIASAPRELKGLARPAPPPLVLKPGHAGGKLILAGHRSHSSHSSHSSHRSHVSGSAHSSHFSSSVRPISGSSYSTGSSSTYTPGSATSGSSSSESSGSVDPSTPAMPTPSRKVTKPSTKKAVPLVPVDWNNPLIRYRLITLNADKAPIKAFIKDLLLGDSKQIQVGEMIGDCKLIGISLGEMSVRLKPRTGAEFTLKRGDPAPNR